MNTSSTLVGEQPAWPMDNINGHACLDAGGPPTRRGGRGSSSRPTRWTSHQQQGVQARPQRTCEVCGDKARSLHFGGLSCDSCKAFFRRAVQSTAYKNFQCPHQSSPSTTVGVCVSTGWSQICVINVMSRKSCQKCRFERCVQIGMEISWVMSEAERQRLLSARLAKRRKLDNTTSNSISSSSPPDYKPLQDYMWPLKPEPVNLENFLTGGEVSSIQEVKRAWCSALQKVPPTPLEGIDLTMKVEDHAHIIRSTAGSVQRFKLFSQPLLQNSAILDVDKKSLLQGSMLEMCIFRSALNHGRSVKLLERYFPVHLQNVHARFEKGMQELALDQTTFLIFLMVILMNSERPELVKPHTVEKIQEYYLMLLNKYISGRYGAMRASALYPRLLSKLADLRELSDCHQEQGLILDHHDVKNVLTHILTADNPFEPPQKFLGLQIPGSPMYTDDSPKPSSASPPSYTASMCSPCDSVSSSSQRFFPQSPPFTDSSSDELYMPITPYDDKEQEPFFPSMFYLQGAMENNNNAARENQDFQPFLQHRTNAMNDRYPPLYDTSNNVDEVYLNSSLDIKPSAMDTPLFEQECQDLVQQCLQEGGGTLLSSSSSSSGVQEHCYPDFSSSHEEYETSSFLISAAFHR